MGKLVVNDIVATLGVAPGALHRVPHQDDRSAQLCLTEDGERSVDGLSWNLEASQTSLGRDDRGGIDEDRLQVALEVVR